MKEVHWMNKHFIPVTSLDLQVNAGHHNII